MMENLKYTVSRADRAGKDAPEDGKILLCACEHPWHAETIAKLLSKKDWQGYVLMVSDSAGIYNTFFNGK